MSQQRPSNEEMMRMMDQKFEPPVSSTLSSLKQRQLPITTPAKSSYMIFPKIDEEDEDPMHTMHKTYNPAQFISPMQTPKKGFASGGGGGKTPAAGSAGGGMGFRQACLCSPTTHAGSFRCRLHRNGSQMKRGFSVGSNLADLAR